VKKFILMAALLMGLSGPAFAGQYQSDERTITGSGNVVLFIARTKGYLARRVTVQCVSDGALTSVLFEVSNDGANFDPATIGGVAITITTSGDIVQVIDSAHGPFLKLKIIVVGTGDTVCTVGSFSE
jgi:hypothetical protein